MFDISPLYHLSKTIVLLHGGVQEGLYLPCCSPASWPGSLSRCHTSEWPAKTFLYYRGIIINAAEKVILPTVIYRPFQTWGSNKNPNQNGARPHDQVHGFCWLNHPPGSAEKNLILICFSRHLSYLVSDTPHDHGYMYGWERDGLCVCVCYR